MSDFAPDHGQGYDQERSHAFDGITEYDNNLPRWWVWMLYISVVVAVSYMVYFHVLSGELSRADADKYEIEIAKAKVEANNRVKTEDELRALSKDPEMIAKGKEALKRSICFTCHGAEYTGLIGPNLRDKYWLYGSTMTEMINTITNGRTVNGVVVMTPQNLTLKADAIEAIACYIVQLNREGEKPGLRPQAAREKEDPITY
jgi:cytochrome c oxidase cbb3-type subunit 3